MRPTLTTELLVELTHTWTQLWHLWCIDWMMAILNGFREVFQGPTLHLGVFQLDLTHSLEERVLAGNNKAALYRLLAALSDALSDNSLVFWGICRQKRRVTVIMQYSPEQSSIAEEFPGLVTSNMKHIVLEVSRLYTSRTYKHFLVRNITSIEYATARSLIARILREHGHVPGMWQDGSNRLAEVLGGELPSSLIRYRVTPGALNTRSARNATLPAVKTVSAEYQNTTKHAPTETTTTGTSPEQSAAEDNEKQDSDFDWVLVEEYI